MKNKERIVNPRKKNLSFLNFFKRNSLLPGVPVDVDVGFVSHGAQCSRLGEATSRQNEW